MFAFCLATLICFAMSTNDSLLLFSGRKRIIDSFVMTAQQYDHAEWCLVDQITTMRETDGGTRSLVPNEVNSTMDDMDDVYEQQPSSEKQAAWSEFNDYCRICKQSQYFPKKLKKEGLMSIGGIYLGVIEERGKDIEANPPFVNCNLADFVDETGYFDLVQFLALNKKSFPYLYKLACCLSSLRTSEVGCERFFSVAGYVSNPRRTRLKVRHYEAIAMLKQNMRHVYVDEDWVVQEYMSLEDSNEWDESETRSDKLVDYLEDQMHNDNGAMGNASAIDEQDEFDGQQWEIANNQPLDKPVEKQDTKSTSSDDSDSSSDDSDSSSSSDDSVDD